MLLQDDSDYLFHQVDLHLGKNIQVVLPVPSTKYNVLFFAFLLLLLLLFLRIKVNCPFLIPVGNNIQVRKVTDAAWSFSITTNKKVSSAKSWMSLFISFTISLIYTRKRKGPKTDFWWTPVLRPLRVEEKSSEINLCLRSER